MGGRIPPLEEHERETHHNQALTGDAAKRKMPDNRGEPGRKVVAIQLNEKERAALAFLGGVSGLKKLLCPEGLCIKCRVRSAVPGSPMDGFCDQCLE